jgi:hypothetical protein
VRSSADAIQRCAEETADYGMRLAQARQDRDAWVARAINRPPDEKATQYAPPRVTLQRPKVAHAAVEPNRPEIASTPPSCDYGVGSEAWLRELERVRQQGVPAFAGASRSEDVIPRK